MLSFYAYMQCFIEFPGLCFISRHHDVHAHLYLYCVANTKYPFGFFYGPKYVFYYPRHARKAFMFFLCILSPPPFNEVESSISNPVYLCASTFSLFFPVPYVTVGGLESDSRRSCVSIVACYQSLIHVALLLRFIKVICSCEQIHILLAMGVEVFDRTFLMTGRRTFFTATG